MQSLFSCLFALLLYAGGIYTVMCITARLLWITQQENTAREENTDAIEIMGFDSISVTQTAKELNDATADFRLEILAGNVEIEGMEVGKEGNKIVVPVDSLLVWSIANAKTISNNYGEIKIDKDITTERIDPIDAIIDAWKHAMKEEYRPDVNETVNEWLEQYEKYMKKGGEK